MTVEANAYTLGIGLGATPMESSPARLFYSFQPAAAEPEAAPLFVLWNGGPAVSTGLLLGTNTGPRTTAGALDGGPPIAANPNSWTSLGNLLYVDARGAGFSYGLAAGASDIEVRKAEFTVANFNTYVDAADFVRVLLGFLAEHPALRDAPVVIVAESYGGVRAGIVLDMLLNHEAYGDGSRRYRDPALVAAIAGHLALRFPGALEFPPALVAEHFGRQVLIQPNVAGKTQEAAAGALFEAPGSRIAALAGEVGTPFVTCAQKGGACDPYDNGLAFVKQVGRSGYDVRSPSSWLQDLFDHTAASLGEPTILGELLGVEVGAIAGLGAGERGLGELGPLRVVDPGIWPADGPLAETLGALAGWDRYYMTWSYEANVLFRSGPALSLDVDPGDPHHGEHFLRNLLHVETLITAATDDVVIYAPSLAPTLAGYAKIVESAEVVADAPMGAERPGVIEVRYVDAPFPGVGAGEVRRIRFPGYGPASHSVTLDQPGGIVADVGAWMAGE